MAEYTAEIVCQRGAQDFFKGRYRRHHLMRFDGCAEVAGSSSQHSVPLPMSDATAVDPAEAFVALLSSCHMLWFLAIAAKHKFCVDRYANAAAGVMAKSEQGKMAMTEVTLRHRGAVLGRKLANASSWTGCTTRRTKNVSSPIRCGAKSAANPCIPMHEAFDGRLAHAVDAVTHPDPYPYYQQLREKRPLCYRNNSCLCPMDKGSALILFILCAADGCSSAGQCLYPRF